MDKLDIYDISEKLIKASEDWEDKMKAFTIVEVEYQSKCDDLLMSESVSGLATQALREAQLRKIMRNDELDLTLRYETLALEVRMLRNRIQMFTTISANLRSIGFNKGGE